MAGDILWCNMHFFEGREGFDHAIKVLDVIIDNIKTDAHVAESPGNFHILVGWVEAAAGVVVDDYVTVPADLQQGWYRVTVATGEDFKFADNLLPVSVAEAEDFVAASFCNRLAQCLLSGYGQISFIVVECLKQMERVKMQNTGHRIQNKGRNNP